MSVIILDDGLLFLVSPRDLANEVASRLLSALEAEQRIKGFVCCSEALYQKLLEDYFKGYFGHVESVTCVIPDWVMFIRRLGFHEFGQRYEKIIPGSKIDPAFINYMNEQYLKKGRILVNGFIFPIKILRAPKPIPSVRDLLDKSLLGPIKIRLHLPDYEGEEFILTDGGDITTKALDENLDLSLCRLYSNGAILCDGYQIGTVKDIEVVNA